jgi:hypothetical protein
MYSTFGFDHNIKNIFVLAKTKTPGEMRTIPALRDGLLSFLAYYQPDVPQQRDPGDLFIDDESTEQQLARLFKADSTLNDRGQTEVVGSSLPSDSKHERMAQVQNALNYVQERDAKFHTLFGLAINSVFFRQSDDAVGGSTSTAIGSIWFAGRAKLTMFDYTELLVHELTHNLLFLDEIRHTHFDYSLIKDKENFAISSILKLRRPLDKVVHSIVVATEIIAARRGFLGIHPEARAHAPIRELTQDALTGIDSVFALKNLSDLTRPRIIEILERCRENLHAVVADEGTK